MKSKSFLASCVLLLLGFTSFAQNGYIYVHLKHINEEASTDYSFTVYNSSGSSVGTFSLNDQATSDNVALSGNYLYIYDIGESHGTGGDGQLWAVCGTSWGSLQASTTLTNLSGTLYYRNAGSSNWVSTGITGVRSVDGAYKDQCVYTTTSGRVMFYNAGTTKTLYTGTDAWDVTANGGKIAMSGTGGAIRVLTTTYSTTAAPSGTTWNTVYTASSRSQLDMKLDGSRIAFFTYNTIVPATVAANTSGTATPTNLTTLGSSTATASNPWDIAYDDDGYIYVSAGNSASGLTGVYSYDGSSWTYESRSGDVTGLTGGAGRSVFGVQTQLTSPADETIFTRIYDGPTNTTYWVDDDRVKSSSSLYGNGVMIAVSPGTYTIVENVPDGYDLGRFNVYDPLGQSSVDVNVNTFTAVVSAGEMVFGEFINEKLNAKAIELNCTFQYLQTFDADNSSPILTYTFGSNTYGTHVEGTAYHYWAQQYAHDGYYYLVKNTNDWFNNTGLTDHTGNGGYFMLINASFQADEFYRQRVTNLVPGLQYTIQFYAANVTPTATTLEPNITFGLQDTLGNNVNTSTSGDITSSDWTLYTFSFTATTSTADLYMTNNGIGGNGNDLAIDDIAINPVITPLPDVQVSPKIAPNVCIGTSYIFSNTQAGGIWTSSSGDVATINPKTGVAQGLTAGTAIITYTYSNQVGCVSVKNSAIIVSAPPSSISISSLNDGYSCNGQTDSLFSIATGGTLPISYSWSGYPSSSLHGLSAADSVKQNAQINPTTTVDTMYSYISLATDFVGCTISDTISVHVSGKTAPALTVSSTNACLGSPLSLTSALSGGDISTPTYTWSTTAGATAGLGASNLQNTTASPTAAGTYTYKMKAFSGYCNVVKSATATAYPLPSITASGPSGTQKLCGTNGNIALTSNLVSAGTSPDIYAWAGSFVSGPTTSPNPGLQSPTDQASASAKPVVTSATSGNPDTYRYTVTVTDINGCTASGSADVTVYAGVALGSFSVTASSSPSTPVTLCSGSSISLSSSSSGGTGLSKSYSWTGPDGFTSTDQNPTTTATSTGNYVVTASDDGLGGTGCMASAATGLFTVNPSPTVTADHYAAAICNNTTDTVYATPAGGTAPYSYAWSVSPGGASATAPTSAISPVSVTTPGQTYGFSITITDDNGCTATGNTTIDAFDEDGPSISGMAADASLCYGSTINFNPTVTAGSNTTTLSPTGEGANGSSGSTHQPSAVDDGDPSTYWRAPNNNGYYVYLDFGSSVIVNSVTIYPQSSNRNALNGARIDISNSSNFSSYKTIYTFNSTPSSGYTTIPSSSFTNAATSARYLRVYFGTARGYLAELSATSGSTVPVNTFAWSANPSNGSGLNSANTQNTTATPSAAGSYVYRFTATDNNGCAATDSTGVQTVNPELSVIALSSNPGFCGTSGTIQLFASPSGGSGTYSSYYWTYTRNIGSGYSYFSSASAQNPNVSLSLVSFGDEFTYNVDVTDDLGCTASDSTNLIVVAHNPALAVQISLSGSACVGTTINLKGHINYETTPPYSYAWTAPSNSSSVNPSTVVDTLGTYLNGTATAIASGNFAYGLLLVDSNNCTATANTSPVIVINDTPKTTLALGVVPSPLCADPGSVINLTGSIGSGTTAPYTYTWSGSGVTSVSSTSTTAQPVATGAFSLAVTDAYGCTGTAYTPSVDVDQASPDISTAACGINSDGVAYVQLYESTGVSWLWSATNPVSRFYSSSALDPSSDVTTTTNQSPFIKIKDLYTVNIVDANGCNGSGSVDATVALSGCVVLNTGILNFTAEKQSDGVLLRWTAPVDIDNSRFDIQRSDDGFTWQTLGTVKAKTTGTGNYNYNFTDKKPVNGTNYYRLRQVDINGHLSYSAVRKIDISTFWAVKQYPNPVSDYLILEFNYDKQEKAFITIQTISGSKVFGNEQMLAKGFNRIKINQVKPLAQGTYILTLATGSNIYRAKFIKGEQ
ncbi:MAG TPA: discoidin domain-containing protein [Chitinophagaceae bacterium]|nr:discoidin domain-containing protein [Chitinophagaceae bacterium]